jgi:hypothetical protein
LVDFFFAVFFLATCGLCGITDSRAITAAVFINPFCTLEFVMIEPLEPLIGPQLKVQKAFYHLEHLAGIIRKSLPKTIVTNFKYDSEFGWHVLIGSQSKTPAVASLAIGDIIHNLRSALDYLACDLARMNDKSTKGVHFPFAESEFELFKTNGMVERKCFDRAGPWAVKILGDLAPYKGGNRLLRALHDLDVQDKHISLVDAYPFSRIYFIKIGLTEYHDFWVIGGSAFKVEAYAGMVREEVGYQSLNFADDGPLNGVEVVKTCHDLCQLTLQIISQFGRGLMGDLYKPIPFPTFDNPLLNEGEVIPRLGSKQINSFASFHP